MATLTENQTDILRKIKNAYESGDTNITDKINPIFGAPKVLTGVLLEKFEELGNTPVDEPELTKTLTTDSVFSFANALATKFKLDVSKLGAMEFASFVHECRVKLTSFKNADGTFKSTVNIENAKLPTFQDVETIAKESEIMQGKAVQAVNEKTEETMDEFKKAKAKHLKVIFKVAGISQKNLTEWEKELLSEQFMSISTDIMNTMFGRHL